MIYNINDINISNEISSLKSAYFFLQEACLSKDRDQINRAYNYATELPIIGLRQRIQFETQRLFHSISPNISVYAVTIDNVNAVTSRHLFFKGRSNGVFAPVLNPCV